MADIINDSDVDDFLDDLDFLDDVEKSGNEENLSRDLPSRNPREVQPEALQPPDLMSNKPSLATNNAPPTTCQSPRKTNGALPDEVTRSPNQQTEPKELPPAELPSELKTSLVIPPDDIIQVPTVDSPLIETGRVKELGEVIVPPNIPQAVLDSDDVTLFARSVLAAIAQIKLQSESTANTCQETGYESGEVFSSGSNQNGNEMSKRGKKKHNFHSAGKMEYKDRALTKKEKKKIKNAQYEMYRKENEVERFKAKQEKKMRRLLRREQGKELRNKLLTNKHLFTKRSDKRGSQYSYDAHPEVSTSSDARSPENYRKIRSYTRQLNAFRRLSLSNLPAASDLESISENSFCNRSTLESDKEVEKLVSIKIEVNDKGKNLPIMSRRKQRKLAYREELALWKSTRIKQSKNPSETDIKPVLIDNSIISSKPKLKKKNKKKNKMTRMLHNDVLRLADTMNSNETKLEALELNPNSKCAGLSVPLNLQEPSLPSLTEIDGRSYDDSFDILLRRDSGTADDAPESPSSISSVKTVKRCNLYKSIDLLTEVKEKQPEIQNKKPEGGPLDILDGTRSSSALDTVNSPVPESQSNTKKILPSSAVTDSSTAVADSSTSPLGRRPSSSLSISLSSSLSKRSSVSPFSLKQTPSPVNDALQSISRNKSKTPIETRSCLSTNRSSNSPSRTVMSSLSLKKKRSVLRKMKSSKSKSASRASSATGDAATSTVIPSKTVSRTGSNRTASRLSRKSSRLPRRRQKERSRSSSSNAITSHRNKNRSISPRSRSRRSRSRSRPGSRNRRSKSRSHSKSSTMNRRSISLSRSHKSRSLSRNDKSRSRSRNRKSRSLSRKRKSGSLSKKRRSRSLSRNRKSRSLSRNSRSRSLSRNRRSRSHSRNRSKSRSRNERSRSRSRNRRSRSRSRNRSRKRQSRLRLPYSRNKRSRSSSRSRRSRSSSRNRRSQPRRRSLSPNKLSPVRRRSASSRSRGSRTPPKYSGLSLFRVKKKEPFWKARMKNKKRAALIRELQQKSLVALANLASPNVPSTTVATSTATSIIPAAIVSQATNPALIPPGTVNVVPVNQHAYYPPGTDQPLPPGVSEPYETQPTSYATQSTSYAMTSSVQVYHQHLQYNGHQQSHLAYSPAFPSQMGSPNPMFPAMQYPYTHFPRPMHPLHQHNLRLPNQHNLGLPNQHNLGLPNQHNLGLPNQHNLGLPNQHNLGLPNQHNLGLPNRHGLPIQHNVPNQHGSPISNALPIIHAPPVRQLIAQATLPGSSVTPKQTIPNLTQTVVNPAENPKQTRMCARKASTVAVNVTGSTNKPNVSGQMKNVVNIAQNNPKSVENISTLESHAVKDIITIHEDSDTSFKSSPLISRLKRHLAAQVVGNESTEVTEVPKSVESGATTVGSAVIDGRDLSTDTSEVILIPPSSGKKLNVSKKIEMNLLSNKHKGIDSKLISKVPNNTSCHGTERQVVSVLINRVASPQCSAPIPPVEKVTSQQNVVPEPIELQAVSVLINRVSSPRCSVPVPPLKESTSQQSVVVAPRHFSSEPTGSVPSTNMYSIEQSELVDRTRKVDRSSTFPKAILCDESQGKLVSFGTKNVHNDVLHDNSAVSSKPNQVRNSLVSTPHFIVQKMPVKKMPVKIMPVKIMPVNVKKRKKKASISKHSSSEIIEYLRKIISVRKRTTSTQVDLVGSSLQGTEEVFQIETNVDNEQLLERIAKILK